MKKKILLADDDADTVLLLNKILVGKGYEVQCLTNAAAIVNGEVAQWPDIFILDKDMKMIDGIAICKFLRLHKTARSIPIVMISGHDCRHRAIAAGVDCYLDKPIDLHELLDVIYRLTHPQPVEIRQ